MSEAERRLMVALRGILRVVETFPPETADAKAVYDQATRAAREALNSDPSRREVRQRELVA